MLNLATLAAAALALLPGSYVEHGNAPTRYSVPVGDTCTIAEHGGRGDAACTIDGRADFAGVFTFATGDDPLDWHIVYMRSAGYTFTSGTWGGDDVQAPIAQAATTAAEGGLACAAIDNRANVAAWARPHGEAVSTTYADRGDHLQYRRHVPRGRQLEALKRAEDSLGIGRPGPKLVVACD